MTSLIRLTLRAHSLFQNLWKMQVIFMSWFAARHLDFKNVTWITWNLVENLNELSLNF